MEAPFPVDKDPASDVAALLRRVRRSCGASQAEVAARAGVSQSMVAAYENGRRQPSVGTLARLLGASGAGLRLVADGATIHHLRVTPPGDEPLSRPPRGLRRGAAPVAGVATRVREHLRRGDDDGAWRWLLQFTDDFRQSAPQAKPWLVRLAPALVGDCRWDAAIAGLVEHLFAEMRCTPPAWTTEIGRFAEPWWFPAGLPALRARALRESPISLKRHGVFVTAEAFDRV